MSNYAYFKEDSGSDPLIWRWDGQKMDVRSEKLDEWASSCYKNPHELLNDGDIPNVVPCENPDA